MSLPSTSTTANTLLVSLWHALFYRGDAASALRLLDSVGFTKAGDVALAMRSDAGGLSAARTAVANASPGSARDWPWQFFAHAATAVLAQDDAPRQSLSAVLEKQLQQQQQQRGESGKESSLLAVLAGSVVGRSGPAKEPGRGNDGFPSLFSLFNRTQSQLAASTEETVKLFAEAKLYAALCLHSYFAAVKPLAKLLVAYIHQEEPYVMQTVLDSSTKQNAGSQTKLRAEARARGVIAGLLEGALAVAESAPGELRNALHRMFDEGENSTNGGVPGVGPRPEQGAAVLSSAAVTLVQLMTQASQIKAAAAESSTTKDRSDAVTSFVDGAAVGREVVHAVQELLFTLVLGAGTVNMPNRPEGSQSQQQTTPSALIVVTHRPLTLREADALALSLFPTLLQQVGYEWPWSELLRHCRSLDKVQATPGFPYVAQSSSLLVESVLLSVSARTYPQRLENLMPESFDRIREKLGLLPVINRAGDSEDDAVGQSPGAAAAAGTGKSREGYFVVPEYYKQPVTALLAYYNRIKLGRLRTEEAEGVLTVAVSTLPMIVQLRALAPPTEGNVDEVAHAAELAADSRSYLLTQARVASLETRYKAECLLASVIVHTQLETPSQVQGMMRELAPLFSKLTLALSRNANALAVPLLTRAVSSSSLGEGQEGTGSSLVFTEEAQKLINDIGYQFYPLEWLTGFAQAFHAQQERLHHSQSGSSILASAIPMTPAASLPYSMFAAVAHQMNTSFHSTLGNGVNSPAGFRGSLVTAPAAKPFLNGQPLGVEDAAAPSGKVSASREGTMMNRLKRAERLLETLMLPCWLDARLSSCDLEGTMAVTATRVVGGGGSGGGGGGGTHGSSSAGAVAGGGGSGAGDGLLSRLSHLLKPRVLELFWSDEPAPATTSRKRERDGEAAVVADSFSNGHKFVEKDEEAVRALTNALLRHGASSFELTMEAKDFVLTVMQCFLPSTTNLIGAESGKKQLKVTAELLRGALSWCQSVIGSPSSRADLRMLLQQRQSSGPASVGDQPFAGAYNSCTFDACALARRVLFAEVPARLLEKAQLRAQQTADLVARRDRCIRRLCGTEDGSDGQKGETPVTEVDRLLAHQWSQYVSLLRSFALYSDSVEDGVGVSVAGEPAVLSAAQWAWYSPYSTN